MNFAFIIKSNINDRYILSYILLDVIDTHLKYK